MADFIRADLRGSRFERVDLSGAQFRAVDLTGARFRGVGLSGVVMRGVELLDVDMPPSACSPWPAGRCLPPPRPSGCSSAQR